MTYVWCSKRKSLATEYLLSDVVEILPIWVQPMFRDCEDSFAHKSYVIQRAQTSRGYLFVSSQKVLQYFICSEPKTVNSLSPSQVSQSTRRWKDFVMGDMRRTTCQFTLDRDYPMSPTLVWSRIQMICDRRCRSMPSNKIRCKVILNLMFLH